MKKTAYIRVSTQNQSYARQLHEFADYFKSCGIDPATIDFVTEKKTSYSNFKNRAIFPVLNEAQPGDIIYACQLDRFGRSVQDVLDLVDFAVSKGVILVTINNGQRIENQTPQGKMLLTMLAAFAEMERSLRAERCAAGKEAEREEIEKNGYRIARCSGKVQTRMGNKKGCDMSAAYTAAGIAHTDRKTEWRENSPAFKWVVEKIKSGTPRNEVIEEFNRLHELQPDVFCTPKGAPLSKGVLSYWLKDVAV